MDGFTERRRVERAPQERRVGDRLVPVAGFEMDVCVGPRPSAAARAADAAVPMADDQVEAIARICYAALAEYDEIVGRAGPAPRWDRAEPDVRAEMIRRVRRFLKGIRFHPEQLERQQLVDTRAYRILCGCIAGATASA